jgi:hypothetical protein
MNLAKVAQVRRTIEVQLDRLRKLEQDMQSATPPTQDQIKSEINLIAHDIRNLDTILEVLIKSAP